MKNKVLGNEIFLSKHYYCYTLSMKTLYKDLLLDHYRNPRNRVTLENADFASQDSIPSCGDSISMQGTIKGAVVQKIAFAGNGCVISQATASLLTEYAVGKTVEQVLALNAEDIQKLIGMHLGPIRLKCALLSLYVLQQGIKKYVTSRKNVGTT